MNHASIVARLREQVSALRLAGGAAEFERARDGLTALPAAFVLPARDVAEPSEFMGQLVQQKVSAQFDALLAVRNLADDEGGAQRLWALAERRLVFHAAGHQGAQGENRRPILLARRHAKYPCGKPLPGIPLNPKAGPVRNTAKMAVVSMVWVE